MNKVLCVLLIDDNPADLALAQEVFSDHNEEITLITCSSATDALKHLRDASQPTPDVVITDLNMPGMSGMDLIREMKDDPQLKLIPVVILSTSRRLTDITTAYSLHANSYLVKASNFQAFVQQVDAFVTYWRGVQRGHEAHC